MTRVLRAAALLLLSGCGPWRELEVDEDVSVHSPELRCSASGAVLAFREADDDPLRVFVEQPTGQLRALPPGPRHSVVEVLWDGAVVSVERDAVSLWDGAHWRHFSLDPPPLWGVDAIGGSGAEHVYLMSWYRIHAREGDVFRAYDAGTWRRANAVAVPGDGRLVVAGEHGLRVHDGDGWVDRSPPTREELCHVAAAGERLWTAGVRTVWEWDGTRWHDRSRGVAPEVRSLVADRNDVYLSDVEGIARWSGREWQRLELPAVFLPYFEICMSATHLYAKQGSYFWSRPR